MHLRASALRASINILEGLTSFVKLRTKSVCAQVLTEAYVAQRVDIQQHQLLSLVLCKIGDADKVRKRSALAFTLPFWLTSSSVQNMGRLFVASSSDLYMPMQAVRDDALSLLNTVSSRVWKDGGRAAASVRPGTPLLHGGLSTEEPGAAVIIGNLQDAHQGFQLHLAITLARWAPDEW